MRPMGCRHYRLVIFTLAVLIMFSSALLPAAYCQSSLPGQGEGPPVNISDKPSFSDLSGDEPNTPLINYLARRGLVKGYPDGTYRQLEGLTRAQAAVMLVQLVKDPDSKKGGEFSDVPGFHWAAAGIRKAASAGLVSGYPDGTFRPDQTLTRAEGTALTLCLSKQPNRDVSLWSMKDVSPDHWAALPISTGLASGMVAYAGDAGEFRPDAPFTRGDMARALAILLIKDLNLAHSSLPIELKVEKGTVTVSRSGVLSQVKDTASIIPGDTISTGAESSAGLYFPDGSGIRLEQNTELTVNETRGLSYIVSGGNPGTAVDWLSLSLTKGELFGALASSYEKNPELPAIEGKQLSRSRLHHNLVASLTLPPPGKLLAEADNNENDDLAWWQQAGAERVRVQVDMPWGVAGIRGTIWHNLVTTSENTTSVLTGKVDITAKSSSVPVLAGQTCRIGAGQAPSEPVAMSAQDRQSWTNVLPWLNKVVKLMETTRRDPLIYKDPLAPGEIFNIPLSKLNQNTPTGGGGGSSNINSEENLPAVIAAPKGGLYSASPLVALDFPGYIKVYFTTDGTDPTTYSNLYTGPISVSTTTTLKFISVDNNGSQSSVYVEKYEIDTSLPSAYATPAGGPYNTGSPVTLSASEQATIYYTTDLTDPTVNSSRYTDPINVTANTTLKFMAVDRAGNQSPVYTQEYTIDTTVPTVGATTPGGIYSSNQTVTLAASETATIYYTTNGAAPTGQSAVYTSPISITANTTIKFIAVDPAGNQSPACTETYIIDTTAPTASASPTGGRYNTSSPVNLTASEPATIYYTTNEAAPTGLSAVYTAPINITANTILKFIAVDLAGNQPQDYYEETYVIDTTAPTAEASPQGGIYSAGKMVALTASEPATIYYTTNGADPTGQSTVYTSPISITANTTLKFMAVDLAGNQSPTYTEAYIIDTTPPTTSASPAGGTYNASKTVILAASEPATIYYTTNEVDFDGHRAVYTDPINITADTTLKFRAVDLAGNQSDIYTETYDIDTTAPTAEASPAGGIYAIAQSVALMSVSEAVYYTTDGSLPTAAGTLYAGPVNIASTTTLKFMAVDLAGNQSPTYTETYIIDTTPPTASASPAGGAYNTGSPVALSTSEPATIYYTTNGAAPTDQSAVYTGPINITANTTLKFMAVDQAGHQSPVYEQTYVIDTTVPTVSASPAGGIYKTGKSVTLAALEPATIHYTTNGTVPTDQSAVYTAPIIVSANKTLKFMAVDLAGNQSPVYTETYVIDTTAPTAEASPAGGAYNAGSPVTLAASEPADIYYTTNGAAPTDQSAVYTGPININANITIKFMAVDQAGNQSPVYTETYVIDTTVPTVDANPAGGSYDSGQLVTLTASEPAEIYYTTDGTSPAENGTRVQYTGAISINSTLTLKFMAVDQAGNESPVYSEKYTIWTIETIDSAVTGKVGGSTSISLDSADNKHITYYDVFYRQLNYAYRDGSGWHSETVESINKTGSYTSLALDSGSRPHISYYDDISQDLKYAYRDNSGWHISTVDSENTVGSYSSLALDSANHPHISYYDSTNIKGKTKILKEDLKYAYWNGSSWLIETVDSSGNVGSYTSIAVDTAGYPHISYYDVTNQALKYAYKNASGWHTSTVDSSGNVGMYSSIALDGSGRAHISYYDGTAKTLKYAFMDSSSTWRCTTVDISNNVGLDTSIALDQDGRPHISYYESAHKNLKYAYKDADGAWYAVIVDSSGNSGLDTCIALDSSGRPYISFFNDTSKDLKCAHQ